MEVKCERLVIGGFVSSNCDSVYSEVILMEESAGEGPIDKSRVLNVKPLRTLTPVFSSPPNSSSFSHGSAPFVCVPPAGPFPPGVSPFFPFSGIPNQSVPSSDHTPISVLLLNNVRNYIYGA